MKRRIIKKWNKVYSNPIFKHSDYAVNCYKRLKQWFPYKVHHTKPEFTIVDWDNVKKYLGINEKENY